MLTLSDNVDGPTASAKKSNAGMAGESLEFFFFVFKKKLHFCFYYCIYKCKFVICGKLLDEAHVVSGPCKNIECRNGGEIARVFFLAFF